MHIPPPHADRFVFLCRWGVVCALAACLASAQTPTQANAPRPRRTTPARAVPPQDGPVLTMAPHSETARYWVSGQANSIFQMHGHFHSPYEGANSLRDTFETKASEVATLYLGYQWQPTRATTPT